MGLAIVHSRARVGVHAPEVRVEVHLAGGLPAMSAALMAPIDTPATQSGAAPAAAKPS